MRPPSPSPTYPKPDINSPIHRLGSSKVRFVVSWEVIRGSVKHRHVVVVAMTAVTEAAT